MRRIRRRLRRSLPWVLGLLVVVGVGMVVKDAISLDADRIVARAVEVREGSADGSVPGNPTVAIDMLQLLLEREPDHYEGHVEAAITWARMRNFEAAMQHLEEALELCATAPDPLPKQVRALRTGINFLIADKEYTKAIEWARDMLALQPTNAQFKLNLGLALYNVSVARQGDLTTRFVMKNIVKEDADVATEKRIEAFVTDIWGTPDPEEVLDELAPTAEATLRDELRELLVASRADFLEAARTMADYPTVPGFDQAVARGYVEMLLRSGRVYDAHIHAATALRQPSVSLVTRRALLQAQAKCSLVIGEPGDAADLIEQVVELHLANEGWVPAPLLHDELEQRVLAKDWTWIESHQLAYKDLTGNDIMLEYAHGAALAATGHLEQAREALQQPFTTLSLGSRLPDSVRSSPDRRRAILMLSHEVFAALGDTRAISALDALLEQFPSDPEGLLKRCNIQRAAGHLELAMEDAFDLLSSTRRRPEDFELWIAIANELSVQRYNQTLEERAVDLIKKGGQFDALSAAAAYQRSLVHLGSNKDSGAAAKDKPAAMPSSDAALVWSIAQQRIPRNQLVRARNELRQLTQAHPQVNEFRLALGKILVREGMLDSAVSEFREILRTVPSDTEVLDLATRLEFALGHGELAASLVNEMIIQDPLGVGAVRYGQQLLERGEAAEANELLKRLVRWPGFQPGRDLYLMSARAFLDVGDVESARGLLVTLSNQWPSNEDVALLGLQVGLADGDQATIDSAIKHLSKLASGLMPDQVVQLCDSLLATEDFAALLEVFPPDVRGFPVLRPALRPLASAAKAEGQFDEADALLASLDDHESLRDRFLLLALQGRADEAGRRLRLASVSTGLQGEQDLCMLAAAALTGFEALHDPVPVVKLRQLGIGDDYAPDRIELLDASLRLLPVVGNLDDVVPATLLTDALQLYPHAGRDIAKLVAIARQDPPRATRVLRSLVMMLLANERPFWARETRFLGEQVLGDIPELPVVSRLLARRYLDAGLAAEALEILKYLVDPQTADPESLEMFLEATQAFGHDEWGIALAFEFRDNPVVRLLLAEALRDRGFLEECLPHYLAYLDKQPQDARGLIGLVRTYAELRRPKDAALQVRVALAAHPADSALSLACLQALAGVHQLDDETLALVEQLRLKHPREIPPYETLCRHYAEQGATPKLVATLDAMVAQVRAQPVELWSEAAAINAGAVRRAARTAHEAGLLPQARTLNLLALQLEPGSVAQFQELAFLELEDGRLDVARRYLEVLSIVRPFDREAPLALARLLFEQIGQPHLAAEVIRQTYSKQQMPPAAVEVLAAEAYLRGDAMLALESFRKISRHPDVTADTILTVARIAFAAHLDTEAKAVFEQFLARAAPNHPALTQAKAMLAICAGASEDLSGGLPPSGG